MRSHGQIRTVLQYWKKGQSVQTMTVVSIFDIRLYFTRCFTMVVVPPTTTTPYHASTMDGNRLYGGTSTTVEECNSDKFFDTHDGDCGFLCNTKSWRTLDFCIRHSFLLDLLDVSRKLAICRILRESCKDSCKNSSEKLPRTGKRLFSFSFNYVTNELILMPSRMPAPPS